MENKKFKKQNKIALLVLQIAFGILVLLLILRIPLLTNPSLNLHDVCSWEHGENWGYEYSKIAGKTCIEQDWVTLETINRKKFNLTNQEIVDKYCEEIEYLDFKRWIRNCGGS